MRKKRVRTLLRVSSKQQLHDNDIPMQRAETLRFISMQKNWEFDKEYIEKAVSAYKNGVEDRKILQQILEDAKQKKFEVLLVYMSDRIGRQEEYSFYIAALNRLQIETWSVKEGQIKTEEAIDRLVTYIKFWQNEGESKKTSVRVHDTQLEMVRAGKFVGGRVPYGYELVDSGTISNHGRLLKKPQIVEAQAEVIKQIYQFAIAKGYGYQKIANALNKQGISAPNGLLWKSGTIANILKNPMYMGYYAREKRKREQNHYVRQDRKEWVYADNQNPELMIISRQDWEYAQEIREARKRRIYQGKKETFMEDKEVDSIPFSTKGTLALSGLVYCGYCGKKLKNGSYTNRWKTQNGEKKESYVGRYLCSQMCKERSTYSQKYLETVVFGVVETYLETIKIDVEEDFLRLQQEQERKQKKELQMIQKEIEKRKDMVKILEEKIPEAICGNYYFSAEKLASLIKENKQKAAFFQEKERKIQENMLEYELHKEEYEKFRSKIPNWKQEFINADVETKKMLLYSLLEKIEVRDLEITVIFKVAWQESEFLKNYKK